MNKTSPAVSSSKTQTTMMPDVRGVIGQLGLLLVVVLFLAIMSFLSPVFLSWTNLSNLLVQSTILMTLALGQTFVIMTRGIDLSIGGDHGAFVLNWSWTDRPSGF